MVPHDFFTKPILFGLVIETGLLVLVITCCILWEKFRWSSVYTLGVILFFAEIVYLSIDQESWSKDNLPLFIAWGLLSLLLIIPAAELASRAKLRKS